jgi:hypothetical protein
VDAVAAVLEMMEQQVQVAHQAKVTQVVTQHLLQIIPQVAVAELAQ